MTTTKTAKAARIETLASALVAAEQAALAADPGQENDGGTCNMDSPTIRLKGWREEDVQAAAAASGVRVEEAMRGSMWKGCRFVRTSTKGQAHRRSSMAEAACRSLRAAGFDASMFYHAD